MADAAWMLWFKLPKSIVRCVPLIRICNFDSDDTLDIDTNYSELIRVENGNHGRYRHLGSRHRGTVDVMLFSF